MDMKVLIFQLTLCFFPDWTEGRSYWSDKPRILANWAEIKAGESVEIICLVPIDYDGGTCRLYRRGEALPFTHMTASKWSCTFMLTSQQLLGTKMVGGSVSIHCDYKLQDYVSVPSDGRTVVVWGSRPSPSLSVSRHVLTLNDSVEVACSPQGSLASRCNFERNDITDAEGPCRRNLTTKHLLRWLQPSLLSVVNLSCTYRPDHSRYIQSEPSDTHTLLILDVSRAPADVHCRVSVSEEQLKTFTGHHWTLSSSNGTNVSVSVTTDKLPLGHSCTGLEDDVREESTSSV